MTGETSTRTLADGNEFPLLGLGVWQVADDRECVDAVRWALELGYRHIDTAQAYGNEQSVGQGLRESGVPRRSVGALVFFVALLFLGLVGLARGRLATDVRSSAIDTFAPNTRSPRRPAKKLRSSRNASPFHAS